MKYLKEYIENNKKVPVLNTDLKNMQIYLNKKKENITDNKVTTTTYSTHEPDNKHNIGIA